MSEIINKRIDAIRDAVRPWVEPFRRAAPQRDAARMLGRIGLGSLGFGGAAAMLMSLRRSNERKLLDEEKAKAQLMVPVYDTETDPRRKNASVRGKAVAATLGVLGLGGTAAGIAYANNGADGKTSANPAARVFNTATGLIPGGQALREEQERYLDLPGTIRGEHAKSFMDVPWFVPGALGVSLLGLGAGYTGVNAMGNWMAKRRLERKRRKAQRMFEESLHAEQQSKLGAALDEFVTACEECAPSIKEASMLEWYLALLGTAGVAGGLAGAYNGYDKAAQKHRLSALKKIRQMQLAKRRNEELSLVPQSMRIGDQASQREETSDDRGDSSDSVPHRKSADLVRNLALGLWKGGKNLFRGAGNAIPSIGHGAVNTTKYLAQKQPLTTLTAASLLGAEGMGHVADRYNNPWGRWKPSTWVFNRFADNQPLRDAQGNPIWGTRRLYSADPNDFAEMKWSWNPFSERGFGWRFRREPQPRRRVAVTDAQPPITELVKKSNPSITMRRKMNERFYDYDR